MLKELCVGKDTDKHTSHSYDEVYENLFARLRHEARHVLEIGVQNGGSMLLWHEYFTAASVTGVELKLQPGVADLVNGRIRLAVGDAYDHATVRRLSDRAYDVIIDDGPHTIESMEYVARHYTPLLAPRGVLVIEDVQDISWCERIVQAFPKHVRGRVQVLDRRHVKDRYDDILVVLDLGAQPAYALRVHEDGTGLCNQLFTVAAGILEAGRADLPIAAGDFLTCVLGRATCPLSEVLDFGFLNAFLSERFGGRVAIEDCRAAVPPETWRRPFRWPHDDPDPAGVDDLLRRVRFHPRFHARADAFWNALPGSKPINVLHVRNESDAVTHHARECGMSEHEYRDVLNRTYVTLVDRYVRAGDVSVVLTADKDANPVVEHMRSRGLEVHCVPAIPEWGRECNAIVDLLVGEKCTGMFVGAVHPRRAGSSFSYVLVERLAPTVRKVLFDPNRPHEPEATAWPSVVTVRARA